MKTGGCGEENWEARESSETLFFFFYFVFVSFVNIVTCFFQIKKIGKEQHRNTYFYAKCSCGPSKNTVSKFPENYRQRAWGMWVAQVRTTLHLGVQAAADLNVSTNHCRVSLQSIMTVQPEHHSLNLLFPSYGLSQIQQWFLNCKWFWWWKGPKSQLSFKVLQMILTRSQSWGHCLNLKATLNSKAEAVWGHSRVFRA